MSIKPGFGCGPRQSDTVMGMDRGRNGKGNGKGDAKDEVRKALQDGLSTCRGNDDWPLTIHTPPIDYPTTHADPLAFTVLTPTTLRKKKRRNPLRRKKRRRRRTPRT